MKPEIPIQEKVLLRVPEAASLLSIGLTECYALIAAGRLRAVTLGSRKRIPRAEVERFAAQLVQEAADLENDMRLLLSRRSRKTG